MSVSQYPAIDRLFARHKPFLALMDRLFAVLTDGETSAAVRVRAAMISAAIGGAVTHPLVIGLDDETLRTQMLHVTRQLFERPA